MLFSIVLDNPHNFLIIFVCTEAATRTAFLQKKKLFLKILRKKPVLESL